MLAQMQSRRGTTAQWLSVNPVLKSGEMGWDTTLKRLKIGDGVSTWTALEYENESQELGELFRPLSTVTYPSANFTGAVTPDPVTVAPAFPGGVAVGPTAGPNWIRPSGEWVNYGGGFFYSRGADWPGNGYASYETLLSSEHVVAVLYPLGTTSVQLYIDDQPMWSAPKVIAPGPTYVDLPFAARDNRNIRVMTQGQALFAGFTVGPLDTFATPRRRFRLGCLGDSYFASSNTMYLQSIPFWIAQQTGFEVYSMDEGGTGFTNDGGASDGRRIYGDPVREAYVNTFDLDALMVIGSLNDAGSVVGVNASVAKAAAVDFYNDMLALRPQMPIIAAGVEPAVTSGTVVPATYAPLNTAMREAAEAAPNVVKFIDWFAEDWLTGNGDDGAPNGSGNQDLFISATDHIHANPAGARYLGKRFIPGLSSAPLIRTT